MKKGFTLIELLAVIVILAIIALIAVPIVLGIIDDSKKSAVIRSGEFYIKGLELAIANKTLDADTGEVKDGVYNIINGNVCLGTIEGTGEGRTCNGELLEVEINGEAPSEGVVAISNGQVAYVEGLKIGNTKISSSVEGLTESENRVICQAVTEKTRLQDKHYAYIGIDENLQGKLATELSYIGSIPEGKYEPGDEYLCEVKPGTSYRFYVLSTNDDNTVNLIMDQNVTSKGTPATATDTGTVEWISQADYLAAGGTSCTPTESSKYTECSQTDKGPITAMNFLKNAVADWSNIQEQNYVYSQQNGTQVKSLFSDKNNGFIYPNGYSYEFNINSRARMIFIEEAYDVGCKFEVNETDDTGTIQKTYIKACPLWLSNNLNFRDFREGASGYLGTMPEGANPIDGVIRGYWIMTGNDASNQVAYEIYDHININATYLYRTNYNGVRPVITISKNNIK